MDERNYGSLPACKKLAEVLARKGHVVEMDAAYYHVYQPVDNTYKWVLCLREGKTGKSLQYDDEVPAYSMPEVWRELRKHIPDFQMHGRIWNALREELFTDALIELWIWVLQEASHD